MTNTEIGTRTYNLADLAGDFTADYDLDAANRDYRAAVEAIAQQSVPSLFIAGEHIIVDAEDRERALDLDWSEIEEQIDAAAILERHSRV